MSKPHRDTSSTGGWFGPLWLGSALCCGVMVVLNVSDPPQPQETTMDEIKLDAELIHALGNLYAKVYACEAGRHGHTSSESREYARFAMEDFLAYVCKEELLPTTEQGTDKP